MLFLFISLYFDAVDWQQEKHMAWKNLL